jgi:hypothetical protein
MPLQSSFLNHFILFTSQYRHIMSLYCPTLKRPLSLGKFLATVKPLKRGKRDLSRTKQQRSPLLLNQKKLLEKKTMRVQ